MQVPIPADQRHSSMRQYFLLAFALGFVLGACGSTVRPGAVLHEFPANVRTEDRYAIYLHGRIVEDQGIRPTDPRFGVYEYEDILAALAEGGLQVISEVRQPNTDALRYAHTLAGQIQGLIDAGVPPSQITIVGVSKGGAIAILTASLLQNDQLQFVLLASCEEELLNDRSVIIAGRVLSIYEANDEMGLSCQPLFARSSRTSIFKEIRLETGLAHGQFYTPRQEWVAPTVEWALGEG